MGQCCCGVSLPKMPLMSFRRMTTSSSIDEASIPMSTICEEGLHQASVRTRYSGPVTIDCCGSRNCGTSTNRKHKLSLPKLSRPIWRPHSRNKYRLQTDDSSVELNGLFLRYSNDQQRRFKSEKNKQVKKSPIPPTSLLLDPHRLDSEGVLPLPSASSVGGASHARKKKWTSTSSMDLEWEVEDALVHCEDSEAVPSLSLNETTMDTCSLAEADLGVVARAVVARRSANSSQISLSQLDWDSQVDCADLLSLRGCDGVQMDDDNVDVDGETPHVDVEAEQLLMEIEALTARALSETSQWADAEAATATTTTTSDNAIVNNNYNNNSLWIEM